jgi:uncharacterized protein (DUF1778 family)
MDTHQPNRAARLEARITPDALAIVRRAAELQGSSVSDFVGHRRTGSRAPRHRGNPDHPLSVEDQARFVDLLLNPPAPTPALLRAAEAHKRPALGTE